MQKTGSVNSHSRKNIFSVLVLILMTAAVLSADDDMISYKNSADNRLHESITGNDLTGVKIIIKNGADVNAVDKYKITTPLITASGLGYLDIVTILVDNGAKINKCVTLGVNALLSASGNGHLKTVEYLVKKGANVNLTKGYRETALMHASLERHLDVVKYLLEHGADPDMQNVEGVTALMFAVQYERNFEVVKCLVENGADVNIRNDNGSTALSWTGNNRVISDYLVSKGAVR